MRHHLVKSPAVCRGRTGRQHSASGCTRRAQERSAPAHPRHCAVRGPWARLSSQAQRTRHERPSISSKKRRRDDAARYVRHHQCTHHSCVRQACLRDALNQHSLAVRRLQAVGDRRFAPLVMDPPPLMPFVSSPFFAQKKSDPSRKMGLEKAGIAKKRKGAAREASF